MWWFSDFLIILKLENFLSIMTECEYAYGKHNVLLRQLSSMIIGLRTSGLTATINIYIVASLYYSLFLTRFSNLSTENSDFKNNHQPTNIYFNIYRRLHIAFNGQFVIQNQGPLNLWSSVKKRFPINKWISREKRK
jgi:hypothetical protein